MNPLSDVCFANNIPSLLFFILLKVLWRQWVLIFYEVQIYQFSLFELGFDVYLWCALVWILLELSLAGVHSASSCCISLIWKTRRHFSNSSFSYILFSFGNSEKECWVFVFSPLRHLRFTLFCSQSFCFSSSDMVNSIDQSSTLLILSSVISTLLESHGKFFVLYFQFHNFHFMTSILFSEIFLFFTFFQWMCNCLLKHFYDGYFMILDGSSNIYSSWC